MNKPYMTTYQNENGEQIGIAWHDTEAGQEKAATATLGRLTNAGTVALAVFHQWNEHAETYEPTGSEMEY